MNIILAMPPAHLPVSQFTAGSISGVVTGRRVMACAPVICVCTGNPLTSSWHGRAVAGGAVGTVQTSPSALAAQLREVSSGLAAGHIHRGVC